MGKAKGDAFAEVTRTMVEQMGEEIKEIKEESKGLHKFVHEIFDKFDGKLDKFEESLRKELSKVQDKQTDLFNHQSTRVPPEMVRKLNWMAGLIGTIIGGAVIAVIGVIL